MKISEMILQLTAIHNEIGDQDVYITDGAKCLCYSGDYEIVSFEDLDGKWYADIGTGGCDEK